MKPVKRKPTPEQLREYSRTSDRPGNDPNDRHVDSPKITKLLRRIKPKLESE